MTARVWTVEELDRVHALPSDWWWEIHGNDPVACCEAFEICADETEVWGSSREAAMTSLHRDVALAVILASKGLDSLGAMAAEMDARALAYESTLPIADGAAKATVRAIIETYRKCAEMLYRGTVKR